MGKREELHKTLRLEANKSVSELIAGEKKMIRDRKHFMEELLWYILTARPSLTTHSLCNPQIPESSLVRYLVIPPQYTLTQFTKGTVSLIS